MALRNRDVGRFNREALFGERLLQDDGQEAAFEGVSLERMIVKVGQLLLLSDEDDADGYWEMIGKHDSTEEGEDAEKPVENNQKIFFCFLVFIFLFVLRMGLRKSFGDFTVRIVWVSQEIFRWSVKGRVSLFSVS